MAIKKHNPEGLYPQYSNYSHAVEVSDSSLLFISGLNGYLQDRKTIPDSFDEQCDLIWGYLGKILKSALMDYKNLVSLRIYLASPEYRKNNGLMLKKYLGNHEPSLTVVCAQLLDPSWLLEIEATAAK